MLNLDPSQPSTPPAGQSLWVEIYIKESLEPYWREWFDDLALDTLQPGQAVLSGAIRDQSALHGILERIRDLNLQLISLRVRDLPVAKNPLEIA